MLWLQTASHYGDLRIPAGRIDLTHRECLADCSTEELVALAGQQGSAGICRLGNHQAIWQAAMRFHAHDAWPEPGDLRRTGPCLMEFAPSGAYVEDWRLQTHSTGPLLSLRLLGEKAAGNGDILPRNGLLLQAGNHAMLIIERRTAPPRQTPLSELVTEFRHDRDTLLDLLDMPCCYAVRSAADADFIIVRSTLPFLEGRALDRFDPVLPDGLIIQRSATGERHWRLETLCCTAQIH